jgi:hypothetical protein
MHPGAFALIARRQAYVEGHEGGGVSRSGGGVSRSADSGERRGGRSNSQPFGEPISLAAVETVELEAPTASGGTGDGVGAGGGGGTLSGR